MGSSCEDSFVATIFLFTTYQNNMKAITCLMKETEVPYFHNFSLFFLFIKNFSLRLLLLFICIIAISGFASAQNDTYTYYFDGDGDGYGKTNSPITSSSPTPPSGYAKLDGDCNDGNASVNPGATEICDGIDNNCDGRIDEGCLPVTISIADVSMNEGNKGKSNMMFAVTLNKAFNKKVTVRFTTQNGTATAGSDYDAKSGTITFTAGSTKQNISISIIGDKTVEPDEMFKVNLSNAVNASIVKGTGTGTILNDDGVTAMSSASLQINNNTSERSVKISPNPVSSILRVDLSGYTGNVTMQLVSLQGKPLKQEKMQTGTLKHAQLQMNVTGIASGTYFLVVIDEKGNRQTEKVIIAR